MGAIATNRLMSCVSAPGGRALFSILERIWSTPGSDNISRSSFTRLQQGMRKVCAKPPTQSSTVEPPREAKQVLTLPPLANMFPQTNSMFFFVFRHHLGRTQPLRGQVAPCSVMAQLLSRKHKAAAPSAFSPASSASLARRRAASVALPAIRYTSTA